MRAHFRGDRPFHGRDLERGGGGVIQSPGRIKTSNSQAFLGLTKLKINATTIDTSITTHTTTIRTNTSTINTTTTQGRTQVFFRGGGVKFENRAENFATTSASR